MERAGTAAADIAASMLAGAGGRVVVLAGPGNNGGDALVCARRLRERGLAVVVVASGRPYAQADAAQALRALERTDVPIADTPPSDAPALIVDGLFGVGLSRAPGEPWASWIAWANAGHAPILALDVPSGLDAATGVASAATIRASATATFIALKPGLLTCDGPDHCGEISVHPLGVERDVPRDGVRLAWPALQPRLPAVLARRVRKSHKGTFGRACIVGGAEGLVGAALLAGRAAIRLGAGRVVVGLAARNPPPRPSARGASETARAPGGHSGSRRRAAQATPPATGPGGRPGHRAGCATCPQAWRVRRRPAGRHGSARPAHRSRTPRRARPCRRQWPAPVPDPRSRAHWLSRGVPQEDQSPSAGPVPPTSPQSPTGEAPRPQRGYAGRPTRWRAPVHRGPSRCGPPGRRPRSSDAECRWWGQAPAPAALS